MTSGLLMAVVMSAQISTYEFQLGIKKGKVTAVSGDTEAYRRHKDFIGGRLISKDKGKFHVEIEEHMDSDTLKCYFVSLSKIAGKNTKLLVRYACKNSFPEGVLKSTSSKLDRKPVLRPEGIDIPEGQEQFGFKKWYEKELQYPKEASEQYLEGPVRMRFTIEADGRVSDVLILKGSYPSFDREVFRALSVCPKWEPAYKEGKPVKVIYQSSTNFYQPN